MHRDLRVLRCVLSLERYALSDAVRCLSALLSVRVGLWIRQLYYNVSICEYKIRGLRHKI